MQLSAGQSSYQAELESTSLTNRRRGGRSSSSVRGSPGCSSNRSTSLARAVAQPQQQRRRNAPWERSGATPHRQRRQTDLLEQVPAFSTPATTWASPRRRRAGRRQAGAAAPAAPGDEGQQRAALRAGVAAQQYRRRFCRTRQHAAGPITESAGPSWQAYITNPAVRYKPSEQPWIAMDLQPAAK